MYLCFQGCWTTANISLWGAGGGGGYLDDEGSSTGSGGDGGGGEFCCFCIVIEVCMLTELWLYQTKKSLGGFVFLSVLVFDDLEYCVGEGGQTGNSGSRGAAGGGGGASWVCMSKETDKYFYSQRVVFILLNFCLKLGKFSV